jgi:hypothetical protein
MTFWLVAYCPNHYAALLHRKFRVHSWRILRQVQQWIKMILCTSSWAWSALSCGMWCLKWTYCAKQPIACKGALLVWLSLSPWRWRKYGLRNASKSPLPHHNPAYSSLSPLWESWVQQYETSGLEVSPNQETSRQHITMIQRCAIELEFKYQDMSHSHKSPRDRIIQIIMIHRQYNAQSSLPPTLKHQSADICRASWSRHCYCILTDGMWAQVSCTDRKKTFCPLHSTTMYWKILCSLSPRANYIDRATTACRRS